MRTRHAQIRRDAWGVPHIVADSISDAWYAVGVAQAEDHAPFVVRNLLCVMGACARHFGPGYAPADSGSLRWRHLELARRASRRLTEGQAALYSSFLAGVENQIRDTSRALGRVLDTMRLEPALVMSVYSFLFARSFIEDGLEAIRPVATVCAEIDEELRAIPAISGASNQWAVRECTTPHGNVAALLSDPHGDLGWCFEFHVSTKDLDLHGSAFPGTALPVIGSTRDLAWASTTGQTRVSDGYSIELESGPSLAYLRDGKRADLHERVIKIRDDKGRLIDQRVHRYAWINNGLAPVVAYSDDGRLAYAVSSPHGRIGAAVDRGLYALIFAPSARAALDSMQLDELHPQNLMLADRHGDIAYRRCGITPRRRPGYTRGELLSGNTGSDRWRGFYRPEELLTLVNPSAGFMQNNNVSPFQMTNFSHAEREYLASMPDELVNDVPYRSNSRGRRAMHLLATFSHPTADDLAGVALDDTYPEVGYWRARLADIQSVEKYPMLRAVAGFEGDVRTQPRESVAYWYWRSALAALARRDGYADNVFDVPDGLLQEAGDIGLSTMHDDGNADAEWGSIFRLGRDDRSVPAGATSTQCRGRRSADEDATVADGRTAEQPLRLMTFGDAPDEQRLARGGYMLRLTFMSEPRVAYGVTLWGQSSNPASPHFDDQKTFYRDRQLRLVALSRYAFGGASGDST
jgi:acyl-homoserine lactone acylase PvdQ